MVACKLIGMTQATQTPSTSAPTGDRNDRERVIRDLYAIAEFYSANPDHPLPWSMQLHHRAESPQQLQALADTYGCSVYGEHPQTDHKLPNTATHVSLMISMPRTEQPL